MEIIIMIIATDRRLVLDDHPFTSESWAFFPLNGLTFWRVDRVNAGAVDVVSWSPVWVKWQE